MSYAWIIGHFLSGKLVYHRATWDEDRAKMEGRVWTLRTDCGLIRWRDDGSDGRGTHIAEVLAARIARPCLRCYPERRIP